MLIKSFIISRPNSDNLKSPVPQKKFSQFLLKNAGQHGLTFSKHIEGKYHIFPDQREGSSSALVLKKPKTKKSSRTLYLTKPLKEELLAWLERLKQDELAMDGRYRNCGQLFRLPNGLPVAPEALSKCNANHMRD